MIWSLHPRPTAGMRRCIDGISRFALNYAGEIVSINQSACLQARLGGH